MFSILHKSRENHEEIKNFPKVITKIKPFINKNDCEETSFPLKMIGKKLRKIM